MNVAFLAHDRALALPITSAIKIKIKIEMPRTLLDLSFIFRTPQ